MGASASIMRLGVSISRSRGLSLENYRICMGNKRQKCSWRSNASRSLFGIRFRLVSRRDRGGGLVSTCKCIKKVSHGAVQLTKALVGLDRASPKIIEARRRECRKCPHATRSVDDAMSRAGWLSLTSRCRLCGCLIAPKTLLASESCPEGKWS